MNGAVDSSFLSDNIISLATILLAPAIVNNILTSADGLRLYVPSASTSFYCLNAKNGNIMWKAESYDSIYLTGAILSPDSTSVYSILHRDGTIQKRSTSDGELQWRFNCSSIPGRHPTCQDSVEAEFSLSSSGNLLYYSDIWGTVVALEVDDMPTPSPTPNPTGVPTDLPSVSPTEQITYAPSSEPSLGPSTSPTGASALPSQEPSNIPSYRPSSGPSSQHSEMPSWDEKVLPTTIPSSSPTLVDEPTIDTLANPRTAPVTNDTQTSLPSNNGSTTSAAVFLKLGHLALCLGMAICLWLYTF